MSVEVEPAGTKIASDPAEGEKRPVEDHAAAQTVVIEPSRGWGMLALREIWRYRELLYFLVWRNIKVRYKQTAIGAAWVVLQPLLTMLLFTFLFGELVNMPSDGVPYPIFSYTALLAWTFFSTAVSRSSDSLVSDANLISKVYFPRVLVPVAAVLAILVDLVISFAILIVILIYYGIVPGSAVLTLPIFCLLALLSALGVALWSSAINVRYRDVGHAVPFMIQFWFFLTPVAYPSSLIPERWHLLYSLNPMVGVVEGMRWALLGTETTPGNFVIVSAVVALFLLVTGMYYFRRTEDEFADVV